MEDTQQAAPLRSLRAALARRTVQLLAGTTLWFLCFFVAAGRTDVLRAWIYLVAGLVTLVVNGAIVGRLNPDVIKARAYGGRGTKAFDRVVLILFTVFMLAVPVVAGLDAVRFGWSRLPFAWLWIGMALYALGSVPIIWAMIANPHLEQTVRIQQDRDHQAVATGPYRHVRHPMYSGMILQQLAPPLVLGSLWAFLPAGAACLTIIVRTALEDATLRRELSGYEQLVRRTRYRLLPGVW